MEGLTPRVSVCMPTYNRPGALDRALGRVLDLEPPPGGYEVVVVDDGSPPAAGIPSLLESWAVRSPVPLRYDSLAKNGGPCGARDRAWRMAAGEWIAFTDDDCLPDREWLVRLLAAADRGADVVQGRTQPDPERAHLLRQPFARAVVVERFSDFYETCNMLYRRQLLEELDGFDHSFPFSAEDTDLGWRAREAGATIVFEPEAVVTHDVVVGTWRSDLRGRRRWGDVVHMIAKHPEARRLAWKPYVYRRAHGPALVYLAALAATVPRPSRRPAAAALVALVGRDALSGRSPTGALRVLQSRIADLYEVAVVVRASARWRTLLL
jgi:glycosyltransferase involved in cell wall biosynthesis